MNDKYKILFIEDNINDYELTIREIRKSKIEFDTKLVSTKEDYEAALTTFRPDIIISDYMLPNFNGMAALEIKKKVTPLTPFIILTGSMNEETAVSCMKAGANDYLIKEHLARLSSAIISAVDKSKIQIQKELTEKAYRESEARFRILTETTASAIFINHEYFIYANKAAQDLCGYSLEEITRMKSWEFVHPDFQEVARLRDISRRKGEAIPDRYELKIIRKDKEERWIEITAGTIDYDGQKSVIVTAFDITARKLDEEALRESEERYRNSFENAVIGKTIINAKGKFLKVNKSFCQMIGYSEIELYKMSFVDITHPQDIDRSWDEGNRLISGQVSNVTFEKKYIRKDGDTICVIMSFIVYSKVNGIPHSFASDIIDITERKKAEAALRESESLFRILLDTTTTSIFIYQNENFIDVNNATLKLTGYTKEEFLKMKIWDIVHPDHKELIRQRMYDRMQGKDVPNRYEFKVIGKDGRTLWVDFTAARIIYKEKNCVIGTAFDITGLKYAFEELRKLTRAVEQSPSSIIITNLDGNIEYVNPKFTQVSGYTLDEVKGKNPKIIQSGLTPLGTYREMWQTILNGSEWRGEILNKKKNGELYWESMIISGIKDFNGKISHYLAVKEDITEKKQSQEMILRSETQFRSVWENSFDAMRLTDENGVILEVNAAYCKLVGKSKSELEGKTYNSVYTEEYPHLVDEFKRDFKSRTIKLNYENEVTYWNGEKIWLEISNSFIELENQPTKLLTIFRNITARKEAEQQLIVAKEKAEEVSKLKSNFLANMSHELRTPMIGILGFAEILRSELGNDSQKEMALTIYTSGNRLLQTLNQLLDLSRIESNKLDLNMTAIKIETFISQHIKLYQSVATNNNLQLEEKISKRNVTALLDERFLIQILDNLINNALKFTKQGKVIVEVDEEIHDAKNWAVIKVIDTGIGISEENIQIIFDEFRQASEGLGRNYEGTGLGLTITKKSIEIMNGKIEVESKLGVGSTFKVSFPSISYSPDMRVETNDIAHKHKSFENGTGRKPKILFVDNDKFSRDFVRLSLKNFYEIDLVDDGETAIQKVSEALYDAILMDIGLGNGMDGVQTTQEIRKIEFYKDVPIIAVTAFAMKGDKEKILSEGLTDYISKPFTRKELIDLLKKNLS